jgi:hypothetical protein
MDEFSDKGLMKYFRALPLSYLADARAGFEPATTVISSAFARLLMMIILRWDSRQ